MNQPPRPLPPVNVYAAAEDCLKRMHPDGRRRTEAFWKERKTNDKASAK